jgi:hypothetical protein
MNRPRRIILSIKAIRTERHSLDLLRPALTSSRNRGEWLKVGLHAAPGGVRSFTPQTSKGKVVRYNRSTEKERKVK